MSEKIKKQLENISRLVGTELDPEQQNAISLIASGMVLQKEIDAEKEAGKCRD